MGKGDFNPLTSFPMGVGSPTGLPAVPTPPAPVLRRPNVAIPAVASSKRNRRLGRRQPRARTKIRLHNFRVVRAGALPTAPVTKDYSPEALAAIERVYLNDELRCCVIAGGYHIVGVETGNADNGTPFLATDAQITADYGAIGGYIPGKPDTDNGCVETDAFAYWTKVGFADGTKLIGWAGVDTSQSHVEDAMFLFENLCFAINLPDEWIANITSLKTGDVWDVAGPPNPNNGHCVVGVGYNERGVLISTWGMILLLTWAAIAKYCGEDAGGDIYVLFTPDQLEAGKAAAPNGYAWGDLESAFNEFAGTLPEPPPPPVKPSPGVTLASAVHFALTLKDVSRILAIDGAPGLDADAGEIQAWITAHWTT